LFPSLFPFMRKLSDVSAHRNTPAVLLPLIVAMWDVISQWTLSLSVRTWHTISSEYSVAASHTCVTQGTMYLCKRQDTARAFSASTSCSARQGTYKGMAFVSQLKIREKGESRTCKSPFRGALF
jgi:hypothetical protein